MINYYNANSATPTLAALNEYNVILASNEDGVPYTDPTGLGNVLATYFNGGGQVVIALFADGGYGVTGTFASSYLLITPVNVPDNADSWSSTAATQDIVPTSPVLANMHSITGTGWHGTQVVEHGGVAVAEWASGDLLAVTGVVTDGNGHMRNRVDLNILPSDVGAAAWTGDAFQLLANAIMYR
jgi:hypothetical protein